MDGKHSKYMKIQLYIYKSNHVWFRVMEAVEQDKDIPHCHEDLRTRRGPASKAQPGTGAEAPRGLLQAEMSLRVTSFPYTTLKGEQKNNQFCNSHNPGETVECVDIQVSSTRLYL